MKLKTFFEKFDQFADAPDAVAKMRELVLELAVQGRLTSALPRDGTVPSVIAFRESVAALANSLGLRSPKEPVEEAEQPFDVPPHWRWMALRVAAEP
jgi:type I restriction enzyme S subunit